MSVTEADIAFALELFDSMGSLTHRKMFGGICIYHDGTVFALVSAEGTIYLKAKKDAADALIAEGCERFHNMPYWALPDAALDDPEVALSWAKRTIGSL